MENLNLNIEHYILNDLEKIFGLPYDYTNSILDKYILKFSNLVKNAGLEPEKKRDIFQFIEKAKNKLKKEGFEDRETSYGSIPENTSANSLGQSVKIDETVNKNISTKTINIDTRFRDDYYNSDSNNFTFNFDNDKTNNVISMSISSIDLPLTNYTFSTERENTTFLVIDSSELVIDTTYTCTFYKIPDGNYIIDTDTKVESFNDLTLNMNNNLNVTTGSIIYKGESELTTFTGGTQQTTRTPIDLSFNIFIPSSISAFSSTSGKIVHFLTDNNGNIDPTINLQKTLGWQLGFRDISGYKLLDGGIEKIGLGNTPCVISGTQYLYISVEDNKSTKNTFVPRFPSNNYTRSITCGTKSVGNTNNTNILTRLNISPNEKSVFKTFNIGGGQSQLNRKRLYDGFCNLDTNIKIKLLDEYGDILSLNGVDWSMTLELEYYA